MQTKVELSDIFNCSVERAFKAPILGDATRFLNGHLFQPAVVDFERDETWGEVNGLRYPITNGNIFMASGPFMADKILQRIENKYWQWTIYDILPKALFFMNRAVGEWTVNPLSESRMAVTYSYTFHSRNWFEFLITRAFAMIQWRGIMKKALAGIKKQAESDEPFIYETRATAGSTLHRSGASS